ncbi:CMGC protein kinase [Kwoniella heveanensis CBS 569]|nr:CMGC protein kinase [Kwoniella heveanensis CBS 569]
MSGKRQLDQPMDHPVVVKDLFGLQVRVGGRSKWFMDQEMVEQLVIIRLIDYEYDELMLEHRLTFPFYATTLSQLLEVPTFPYNPPDDAMRASVPPSAQEESGVQTITTIIYSLLSAVNYLHTWNPPIAHRDINPSNVMIDWDGSLKLGDLGTAWWLGDVQGVTGKKSLVGHGALPWVENGDDMCCVVGTGPYRAPELLISPTRYDALGVDLWATGCTIAQLFTSYRPFAQLRPASTYDSDSSESGSCDPLEDDTYPRPRPRASYRNDNNDSSESELRGNRDNDDGTPSLTDSAKGTRQPLFDASFGSLGLAASIFRTLGTPTPESWPSFRTLPDANKVEFPFSPPTDLGDHMPELHRMGHHAGVIKQMLSGLIVLGPSKRMSVGETIKIGRESGLLSESSHNGERGSQEGRETLRRWVDP